MLAPTEPEELGSELTSVLPIDRDEFAVMATALGLRRPSRLSPLVALLEPQGLGPPRSWDAIREPLDTTADLTYVGYLSPLLAPDRILELRATSYEGAPTPCRLYSSRRAGRQWAALRPAVVRDYEVVAPYTDADFSYFVRVNLELSPGIHVAAPWESLTGSELAFFCLLVDAFRASVFASYTRRRSFPKPFAFDYDAILEAQRDSLAVTDRRWLHTALGEALGVLVHPGGDAGVTFPVLSPEQVAAHVREWAQRRWLTVLRPGANPTLHFSPVLEGVAFSLMAWTTMVVLHDVEVVGVANGAPAAQEEVLLFLVTGQSIWALVSRGLTDAQADLGGVTFALRSVSVDDGVKFFERFLAPIEVTLPDEVYGETARVQQASWQATHRVAFDGLPAYANAGDAEPVATLGERLPVQVTATLGEWAHVVASNGWEGWVDRRYLETG